MSATTESLSGRGGARKAPRRRAVKRSDVALSASSAASTATAPIGGRRRLAPEPSNGLVRRAMVPAVAGLATVAVAAVGASTSVSVAGSAPAAQMQIAQVAPASALSGSAGAADQIYGAGAAGGAAPRETADADTAADTASAADPGTASGNSGIATDRDPIISRSGNRDGELKTSSKLIREAQATVRIREKELAEQAADAQTYQEEVAANAWVVPTSNYRITATFGQSSGLWASVHTGLDFAAPAGTPIVAVAGGTVTETGYDGSYGNKTVITLEDGTEIWFCHQTSINVSVGDVVRSGEVIGTVGSTGNSTGPHLHLEVRPGGGDPVDPFSALLEHGVSP